MNNAPGFDFCERGNKVKTVKRAASRSSMFQVHISKAARLGLCHDEFSLVGLLRYGIREEGLKKKGGGYRKPKHKAPSMSQRVGVLMKFASRKRRQ